MSNELYTPADYMRAVHDVLGRIDLDPASNARANAVVRAVRFFNAKLNGLKRRWKGRVFLNCPYSEPFPWAEKLIEHFLAGEVTEAISLWNSRTGSRWFDLMSQHAWRCEHKKRMRFWGPGSASSGGKGNGMQDQVTFYVGSRPERFAARFAEYGRIYPPNKPAEAARRCDVCTRPLEGRRLDSETCSNACRQRRLRKRWAAA